MEFTEYYKEVLKYISNKCPELKTDVVMDIAAFVTTRAIIISNDLVTERDRQWTYVAKREPMKRPRFNKNVTEDSNANQ